VAGKLVRLRSETPQFRQLLGSTYLKLGRPNDRAHRASRRPCARSPTAAEALSALADARMAQGRTDEALVLYARAVDLRPDFADAHFGRGPTPSSAKGEIDEALGAFAEAGRRPAELPRGAPEHRQHLRAPAPAGARTEHYLAALELEPDFALAHHALALLLAATGRTQKALVQFRRDHPPLPNLRPRILPSWRAC